MLLQKSRFTAENAEGAEISHLIARDFLRDLRGEKRLFAKSSVIGSKFSP
jgi:hypothetical protein